jgi:hypothetical protein
MERGEAQWYLEAIPPIWCTVTFHEINYPVSGSRIGVVYYLRAQLLTGGIVMS